MTDEEWGAYLELHTQMRDMPDDFLLPARQAAVFLLAAEKTLKNLRSVGGGPPYVRLNSRNIAYKLGDLRRHLAEAPVYRFTAAYE